MNNEKERLYEIIKIIKDCHLIKELNPKNLRIAIENLGPTFIKLGQIMSTRDDIIPSEYCEELKQLRSKVKPMDFDKVIEILNQEYNGKTNQIFKTINKTPIGSASIAQVHKAILKEGDEVVVKIQRENINNMMEMDVKLLKKAISLLQIKKIFNSVFNFNEVLDEMFETAKEEMNFEIEASHMEKFQTLNSDVKYLSVPKVYRKYTTTRVLVMENIKGFQVTDQENLKSQGYDMDEIAKKLSANYVKQAIDDGYFHADPHPDNIKIQDGKIVYLDFGMMGTLKKEERKLLSNCIIAIIQDDIREVGHILLTLGKTKDSIDYMKLYSDIKKVLDKTKSKDFSDIDIKEFTSDMLTMLSSNSITLPKDITMLIRGIAIIEGVLKEISPSINLIQILSTHVKPNPKPTKEEIATFLNKTVKTSKDLVYLPNEALTFLKGINSGELKFNIEIGDSKHQLRNIEQLVHLVIITILDVAYIIGTSLIVINNKNDLPFIFYIYLILGGLCTLWLFYKLFSSKWKNRRK